MVFPVATYAMESLDLSQYDIVLTSSATVAKYEKVPNGKHICYCYIPTRAIWHFNEYFRRSFKAKALKLFLPYLRRTKLCGGLRKNRQVRGHLRSIKGIHKTVL